MLLTIAAIILFVLLVVWYMQPSASERLLGKSVTITAQVSPLNSYLCNAPSVTAVGIVTRVNSDESVGVTWNTLVANQSNLVTKPSSPSCTWRRTPADSDSHIAWNNNWFGNDIFNPIANYGLQSVYPKDQINRLSVIA